NEIREHTNPRLSDTNHNGRKDGLEDADRDRLNNTGEDQAGDDPVNPDSDGDGVKDGDEGAGKVTSFDGTQLVLRLFSGATLTGTVDESTEVWCEGDSSGADDTSTDDTSTDDTGDDSSLRVAPQGADDSTDDSTTDDSTDDPGADDTSGDSGPSCTIDDIEVGAVVSSASIDFGSGGGYFSSLELAP
ncbi:MAG: hypothetical protein V7636_2552, partial [Actinomycetota bacterium]